MSGAVYLIATLDTKGAEAAFLRDALTEAGVSVVLLDAGCLGEAQVTPDVDRAALFAAAGADLDAVRAGATAARRSPWPPAEPRPWCAGPSGPETWPASWAWAAARAPPSARGPCGPCRSGSPS